MNDEASRRRDFGESCSSPVAVNPFFSVRKSAEFNPFAAYRPRGSENWHNAGSVSTTSSWNVSFGSLSSAPSGVIRDPTVHRPCLATRSLSLDDLLHLDDEGIGASPGRGGGKAAPVRLGSAPACMERRPVGHAEQCRVQLFRSSSASVEYRHTASVPAGNQLRSDASLEGSGLYSLERGLVCHPRAAIVVSQRSSSREEDGFVDTMDDTTRLTRTHSMVYSAMLDDGSPHPGRSSKLYKAAIVSIVLLLAAIVTAAIAIPLSTASSNKASASVSAPYSPNEAPVQLLAAPAPAPAGSRKPSPVVITVQGSDAKLKWSRVTQAMFEEEYKNWKGRGIKINLQLTSSRLRPETLPTVYTPSNIQWVETSQADGTLLVSNLTERCRYSLRIPLGLVMWRQKAKLLGWPEGNLTLQALVQLAGPDAGWNAVPGALPDFANQPFKYGHGNPNASNSGREITIATIYSILGKPVTENLTVADVWANATQQGMRQIQRSVTHLDFHDRDLLEFMVEKGPSYLDAAVTYEPMVVEFNEANGTFLRDNYGDDFAFVFPADGTYWNFHPHCVLDLAPWNQNLTDPDLLDAAQVYVEWTSGPTAQQAAPVNGYRAYDPSVPYNAPAPSVPYQTQVTEAAGADPVKNEINVPRLQYQDTNVVFEINRMWKLAKKPVLVCMAIDTSLSMSGTNDMQDVKNAALSFIQSMTDNDYMRLLRFDQHVGVMQSGWMRDTRQEMQRAVQTMHASGRGSALYGTLVQCSDFLLQQMASYGPGVFNYEVVILSDGNGDDYLALKKDLDNLVRFIQETTTLNNLTSNGPLPLHVYGILYDTGLDTGFSRSFFEDIANQTSGKAYPFANQTSLQTIYEEIALYF